MRGDDRIILTTIITEDSLYERSFDRIEDVIRHLCDYDLAVAFVGSRKLEVEGFSSVCKKDVHEFCDFKKLLKILDVDLGYWLAFSSRAIVFIGVSKKCVEVWSGEVIRSLERRDLESYLQQS